MKQMMRKILALSFLTPALALAHTGAGETAGWVQGFSHPLGGADHLLAMVAVGLWAAQLGGRALWAVPAAFVAAMMLGGLLGISGVPIPFIEQGILSSVLVLGVLIACAFRLPLRYGSLLVALFALFHGHAHGAEIPALAAAGAYTFGFALATALLHAAGIGLGLLARTTSMQAATRLAGAAIALSGLYLAIP
jgi:urease accessory protein